MRWQSVVGLVIVAVLVVLALLFGNRALDAGHWPWQQRLQVGAIAGFAAACAVAPFLARVARARRAFRIRFFWVALFLAIILAYLSGESILNLIAFSNDQVNAADMETLLSATFWAVFLALLIPQLLLVAAIPAPKRPAADGDPDDDEDEDDL